MSCILFLTHPDPLIMKITLSFKKLYHSAKGIYYKSHKFYKNLKALLMVIFVVYTPPPLPLRSTEVCFSLSVRSHHSEFII